jgi:Reverse transcriptase (RNA-dependent DNA polymerase)
VSSSFVIWQEGSGKRKGRFIVNFAKQSKHRDKGSVRMETLPAYALERQKGDHMISFDIQSGYRHFRFAPHMRDMFLFRYAGRLFQCLALPFGWGRSPMWFTKLLRPMVQHLRSYELYRVLAYLDDFLVVPSEAGAIADLAVCEGATSKIDALLEALGLIRHPTKGEWVGSTRVEHLGAVIDTEQEKFFIAPRKIEKIRAMAGQLLSEC